MGILQLPTYTPTQIETHKVREVRPDLASKARMGQSLAALQASVAQGIGEFGKIVAAKYQEARAQREADEEQKARVAILKGDHDASVALSQKPINVDSPEYGELTYEEQLAPNYSYFMKDHDKRVSEVLGNIKNSRVRKRVESWTSERRITVGDALAAWDAGQAKAVGLQNLKKDLDTMLQIRNAGGADFLIENAWKQRGLITEVQAREYSDNIHASITAANMLDALKAPGVDPVKGMAALADPAQTVFVDQEGVTRPMPAETVKSIATQYKDFVSKRDDQLWGQYAQLHLVVKTPEECEAARSTLTVAPFFDDKQRKYWDDAFASRARWLENDARDKTASSEKAKKAAMAELETEIERGLVTLLQLGRRGEAQKLLWEVTERHKDLDPGFVNKWLKEIDVSKDPNYDYMSQAITDASKEGKWDSAREAKARARVHNAFVAKKGPWTPEEIDKLVYSAKKSAWDDVVNSASDLLMHFQEVQKGAFTLPAKEALKQIESSAAYAVRYAQEKYPEEKYGINWAGARGYADEENAYGGGPGAVYIKAGKTGELYGFKLSDDGKKLMMMHAELGGEPLRYVWQEVVPLIKPPPAPEFDATQGQYPPGFNEENTPPSPPKPITSSGPPPAPPKPYSLTPQPQVRPSDIQGWRVK